MPKPISIGMWGTFDVENFGDQLFPLIARRELRDRLGDVELRAFSPWGWEHPTRLDHGEPAEPLGPRHALRCAELAQELDCVLVGGGEIIHTRDELLCPAYGVSPESVLERAPSKWFIEGLGAELERACPVLWHCVGIPFDLDPSDSAALRDALEWRPYVSVRDAESLHRLHEAGAGERAVIVPDSGFLLGRLFAPEVLERRHAFHRQMGWVPPGGEPLLVVQGNKDLVRFADRIAAALRIWLQNHPEARVVLAELGPCHGDAEFLDALEPLLPEPAFRLPEAAGLIDILSLINAARCFVGISLHGNIAALTLGHTQVILNLNEQSKLDGFAAMCEGAASIVRRTDDLPFAIEVAWGGAPRHDFITETCIRVDQHFDQVATLAEKAAAQRADRTPGEEELRRLVIRLRRESELLRQVVARTSERLAEERLAMADRLEAMQQEFAATRHPSEQELELLRATKTFRYTSHLRERYAALRRTLR